MNEEIIELREELQDHIKRCNKLLNKIGQSMGNVAVKWATVRTGDNGTVE